MDFILTEKREENRKKYEKERKEAKKELEKLDSIDFDKLNNDDKVGYSYQKKAILNRIDLLDTNIKKEYLAEVRQKLAKKDKMMKMSNEKSSYEVQDIEKGSQRYSYLIKALDLLHDYESCWNEMDYIFRQFYYGKISINEKKQKVEKEEGNQKFITSRLNSAREEANIHPSHSLDELSYSDLKEEIENDFEQMLFEYLPEKHIDYILTGTRETDKKTYQKKLEENRKEYARLKKEVEIFPNSKEKSNQLKEIEGNIAELNYCINRIYLDEIDENIKNKKSKVPENKLKCCELLKSMNADAVNIKFCTLGFNSLQKKYEDAIKEKIEEYKKLESLENGKTNNNLQKEFKSLLDNFLQENMPINLKINSNKLKEKMKILDNLNELNSKDVHEEDRFYLDVDKEELEKGGDITFEKDLGNVLGCFNKLEVLHIQNKSRKKMLNNIDLGKINEEITELHLSGVDLSQANLDEFFKSHKNLIDVRFKDCNICDCKFLKNLSDDVDLRIDQSYNISPVSECSIIFRKDMLTVNDIKLLKDNDLFDLSRKISVRLDEDYLKDVNKIDDEYIENINKYIPTTENVTMNLSKESANKLRGKLKDNIKVCLNIKDASELSVEEVDKLNEDFNLESVQLMIPCENSLSEDFLKYDVPTYRACREKIDKLLQGVNISKDEKDVDAEKKIFGKVLKILANHMSYDYQSLKDEEKCKETMHELKNLRSFLTYNDEKILEETKKKNDYTKINCRNMVGGLLNNTCVCAGYAEIARNVFACCNIDCRYIEGCPVDLGQPGHAWNQIKLDNDWYNFDLTWDRDNIVAGIQTEFTLKSDKDFKGHDEYVRNRTPEKECTKTVNIPLLESYIHGKSISDGEQNPNKKINTQTCNYYRPDNSQREQTVACPPNELKNNTFLNSLEADLTESDINRSKELLEKAKANRDEMLKSVKMEETYDNR